ncbi:AcrR family transcriptional regulator [Micromonospora echinospora]|uniref:AcrR family transcriptional regulator n=1 Tax=Micromonospora echinospora TaxID=1877 RepID=A0ABR6MIG4_MICEC|nr:AcrR family transcriptional regulator [Micromonospora echinospora]
MTTQQIARAAGIGEATVFRVFTDKEELLQACVAEAMDSTTLLQELRSISLELPLAERLVEAGEALDGYLGRMGAVISALHATGLQRGRAPVDGGGTADEGGAERGRPDPTREAISELFEPEHDRLRHPAGTLAEVFLSLTFGRGRFLARGDAKIGAADLVDLFLHGAVDREETA